MDKDGKGQSASMSLHFGRYEVVDENIEISDEFTCVTAIVTFAVLIIGSSKQRLLLL